MYQERGSPYLSIQFKICAKREAPPEEKSGLFGIKSEAGVENFHTVHSK
jgi:hypothetical protein